MRMRRKHITVAVWVVVLAIWIASHNASLETNEFKVESKRIPAGFDRFRIVQISDLHNAEFGKNNSRLLAMLERTDADLVVITGDIIDARRTNLDVALSLAREAARLAPTYYVNGNHESQSQEYGRLRQGLADCGVVILEDEAVELAAEGQAITLIGITDPAFPMDSDGNSLERDVPDQLSAVVPDNDTYKILLAHRPEFFPSYVGKVDLVLSGHAHGGQFILPLVGGLVAPGQGLFPEYHMGIYAKDSTKMIVSRGLGNSIIPFRINNRPEIVVAELTRTER